MTKHPHKSTWRSSGRPLCRKRNFTEVHGGVASSHYAGRAITQKIMHAGLWWPMVHKDAKEYSRVCDSFQWKGRPSWRDKFSLNPLITFQVFDKWVFDFVGLIQPPGKKKGTRYIITTTKYLMRWVEAQIVKDYSAATIVKFFFWYILS